MSCSGEKNYWYFHPELKIIPLIALAYHEVTLALTVVDKSKPEPGISLMYAHLDSKFRHNCAQMNHIFNRTKNNEYLFICSGMLSINSRNTGDNKRSSSESPDATNYVPNDDVPTGYGDANTANNPP